MAEISDHGQQCDLRTRRGASFALTLELAHPEPPDGDGLPEDITGATAVTRIYADGKPDVVFSAVIDGPAGTILISLSAAQTLEMQQNWGYVVGWRDAAGATHPALFGAFYVSQDRL